MEISSRRESSGEHRQDQRVSRIFVWLFLFLAVLVLSACYPAPYRPIPRSMPGETATAPQVPPTQVYFYPKAGQTTEQQSRDHYDCYNWAVQQTGFDPGRSAIPTDQRVRVVPMPPPGHDTVTLAVAVSLAGVASVTLPMTVTVLTRGPTTVGMTAASPW